MPAQRLSICEISASGQLLGVGAMADKVSPGSKFRGSPLTSAATVNGILDAAEDYTKRRQLGRGVDPIRKTLPTDIVRVRNNSGGDRRAGEVMRVGNAIIDQLTNEFLWFQGLAPNTSERFGILRKALPYQSSGELQVSGVCKAWVNITDLSHERAKVTPGSYVLTSADTGQFKLLWTPGVTGQQDCVVVFADKSSTGASRALAKLTAALRPTDECATVECITGDCDAPTSVCNTLKLSGQAGNLVVIEKFTPCSAVCGDPYQCQIAGCESTKDAYGDSSCGAPDDPCEPFWVITQVEHSKAASCQFTLNGSLTTSTASVSANVERVWGDTTVAVDDTITVYNHDTATASEYIFEGVSGAWGTALWDSTDEKWRIIQLECP